MPTNTVRVIANPYHTLDHKGRPAGTVLRLGDIEYVDNEAHPDVSKRWQPRQRIGATLKAKELRKAVTARVKGRVHTAKPAVHDRTWEFSIDPVSLDIQSLATRAYYRKHIHDGSLFVADVESWVTLGNKKTTFVDPLALLADAKTQAIASHVANHGEDSVPETTHSHWGKHLDDTTKALADVRAKDEAEADVRRKAEADAAKPKASAPTAPVTPALAATPAPVTPPTTSSPAAVTPAPAKTPAPATTPVSAKAVEA